MFIGVAAVGDTMGAGLAACELATIVPETVLGGILCGFMWWRGRNSGFGLLAGCRSAKMGIGPKIRSRGKSGKVWESLGQVWDKSVNKVNGYNNVRVDCGVFNNVHSSKKGKLHFLHKRVCALVAAGGAGGAVMVL